MDLFRNTGSLVADMKFKPKCGSPLWPVLFPLYHVTNSQQFKDYPGIVFSSFWAKFLLNIILSEYIVNNYSIRIFETAR